MKRRGRPPYPDILTPRQWQVLLLLREGLSNEQIALRLGISLDGVKFHVSEILGKLGVSNRNEAANWQREAPEPASPSASLTCGDRRRTAAPAAAQFGARRRALPLRRSQHAHRHLCIRTRFAA